jgi:hypothetical protein
MPVAGWYLYTPLGIIDELDNPLPIAFSYDSLPWSFEEMLPAAVLWALLRNHFWLWVHLHFWLWALILYTFHQFWALLASDNGGYCF